MIENTGYWVIRLWADGATIYCIVLHVSANIGKSSTDVARDGRARCLIRSISFKTAWDAMASADISQGNRMKGMYQESDGGSWAVIPLGWPFLLRWRNGDPGAWRSVASG
jgi:hypothetical protein